MAMVDTEQKNGNGATQRRSGTTEWQNRMAQRSTTEWQPNNGNQALTIANALQPRIIMENSVSLLPNGTAGQCDIQYIAE